VTATAQAAPVAPGMTVWSRKLNWGLASGDMIRDRYGVTGGELGQPDALTVARAAREHMCRDCLRTIPKGALYGVTSGGTSHYCAGCIVLVRPEDQFKTKAA
jgi:hypothetical protein